MILPDANLLLYAYDRSSPYHAKARPWWESCLSGRNPVYLCPMVLSAFVRLATHPRVYENPMTIAEASGHVSSWLGRKVSQYVALEKSDLLKSLELLEVIGLGGDLTTDAQIAAIALRLRASVHTSDSDFKRFAGLKVVNPLSSR
ncbi:MAG: TA system VapC family ribonuclease toxin [Opitutaceae bacterium]